MADKEVGCKEVRCPECNKLLALKLEGKLELYCPRCKHYAKFYIAGTVKAVS